MPPHSVVEVTPTKFPTGELRKRVASRSTIPLSAKTLDSVFDFGEKRQIVTTRLVDRKNELDLKVWQESGKGTIQISCALPAGLWEIDCY